MNREAVPDESLSSPGCSEFGATAARLVNDLQMILTVRPSQLGEQHGLLSREHRVMGVTSRH